MKTIEIPYGHTSKSISVPENNLAWICAPKNEPPIDDLEIAIHHALLNPIDSPSLKALVTQHGRKTVIIVDDNTRATPQSIILPILLDELNRAGVADDDITILIALGTHRPMDENESIERFGKAVMERVKVVNLSHHPNDFENLGVSPLGIPIEVSRLYLESDMSIAVGNIIPHMYAGWAGGAKMVQPGVSSSLTTSKTHLMAATRVYEILGQAENPVRLEIESIAQTTGLKFILNVVLNRDGQVVQVVAGDPVKAHRSGVAFAKNIYQIDIDERPDIVLAGSHPADRDLWQGFKPLNNCGMLVKNGGTLILVIPADEGIAPDHPELIQLGMTPDERVLEMVENGEVNDLVAAATYIAFVQTRKRIHVSVVSHGILKTEADNIGISLFDSVDAALQHALQRHGCDSRMGVATRGADIMGQL